METIIVQDRDRVRKITLNRPEVLNATNEKMGFELNQALRQGGDDDSVACVVLTGAGRAFCAGEDIAGFKERNFVGLDELLRRKYHPIILRLHRMEKPVIAALNGIAAGGGASIALACDIRIASETASLKMAFIGMGLVPDAGSSYFLTRLVGPSRAFELAITGRTVSAQEAERMGLVNRVVPPSHLDTTVSELGRQIAAGPKSAIGLTKRLFNRAPALGLADALEWEAQCQKLASETSDHREAAQAFLEKRLPRFS